MNFDQPQTSATTPESAPVKNENGQVPATAQEIALAEQWLNDHPVQIETRKSPEQGIAEFENMIADFEATYSLEELNAITDLSADPERKHPLRDPAKEALKPIFIKLKEIKDATDISDERYEKIKKDWKRLSNAVGVVNKGIVDHTR